MEIKVCNLTKSFGDNTVLNNFSEVFSDGLTTCIMGESGCGKTTLLKILDGTLEYESGEVTNLENIKKSVVFQNDRLIDTHTVYRNIRVICGNGVTKSQILNSLGEVGLSNDVLYEKISNLSGGMKRRISIICAVLYGGEVFLLDEPTKGLDDNNKKNVIDYIKANTKGKTVIWVTHDKDEANYAADKTVYMKKEQ